MNSTLEALRETRNVAAELINALERINHLATVELNGIDKVYYVTNRGDIAAESRKALAKAKGGQ
jgi:hypothetical protein